MQFIILLALVLLSTPSFGYYTFRTRIPNGEIVPHPCKANYMWSGVGHNNPDGGGDRNPFGRDFHEAGYQWTRELCIHDSDGDGITNGEELGDPNCIWRQGEVPERVTDISHPGICDPFREGVCAGRDDYVDCSIERFDETCGVINNEDVQSVDFRFKEFEIPNTETNYYCQYFDLPTDGDYHVVADEGIIDNHDVVHHMILYACPEDYKSSPTDDSPNLCSMSGEGRSCNTIISLWTVGFPGNCNGEKMGYKMGTTGYKKVKLEIHYNNPMLATGHMDTSGVRIYFQPDKEGVEDLATFGIGQIMIQIPPGMESVSVKGSCPSDCTRSLITQPMHVVSTLHHMHYMGRSQRTEVIRDGQVVKVLADDTRYDYDSPVMHKLEEPFEVLPGDELFTTCTYSSMSKKRWVFYGDATSDEMCFSFLVVYPFDALPHTKWCPMRGPLSPCDYYTRAPKYGCDWNRFTNLSNPEMLEHYINLEHNCNLDGICRPECKELVEELKQHPCFGKEMNALVSNFLETYHEGTQFLGKLHSCDGHRDDKKDDFEMNCHRDCGHMCDPNGDNDWKQPNGAGSLRAIWMASFMTAAAVVAAILL